MDDIGATAHLNKKLLDAVKERGNVIKECEEIISRHFPKAFDTIDELNDKIHNSPTIEYPNNYFSKDNLFNSNYHDINFHDYENFFYLCSLHGLNGSTGKLLNTVMSGEAQPPVLVHGKNNLFWLYDGNVEMMAYKVLGLFPLIKQIDVNVDIII